MPWTCFSYPADATPDVGSRDNAQAAPRTFTGSTCFFYTADVPAAVRKDDAAAPVPSGPRRMTSTTCFRY